MELFFRREVLTQMYSLIGIFSNRFFGRYRRAMCGHLLCEYWLPCFLCFERCRTSNGYEWMILFCHTYLGTVPFFCFAFSTQVCKESALNFICNGSVNSQRELDDNCLCLRVWGQWFYHDIKPAVDHRNVAWTEDPWVVWKSAWQNLTISVKPRAQHTVNPP